MRVISLAENEGVPARNLALAKARGKYVAFLDDDTRPIGRALSQAMTHLARHPKTAAVVGRVVLPDGSADAPATAFSPDGRAQSVVRKSILDEVGGFAAEFFRQAADYELSFRIWGAGFRIERFEDLQFSREGQNPQRPSDVACRMDLRNNLILCERFLPKELRRAYRQDWMRRYALLAHQPAGDPVIDAAIKQARVLGHDGNRRSAARHSMLSGTESIFGNRRTALSRGELGGGQSHTASRDRRLGQEHLRDLAGLSFGEPGDRCDS